MMVSKELLAEITEAVGEAQVALRMLLDDRGLQVVNTNYAHDEYDPEKISGTQKKGLVCRLTEPDPVALVKRALKAIGISVLVDVDLCPGSNCYLLNWFNVEFKDDRGPCARVTLRGCPAVAPEGFDFARASAELTGLLSTNTHPYGWDLRCHPAFVKNCSATDLGD